MTGRPSTYTEELADEICERLVTASMRKVCQAEDMPHRSTVDRWMDANPAFAAKCARARIEQAEHNHDEMREIESRVLSGDLEPQAANVVLSNKRWRMEKLDGKRYGSKVDLTSAGDKLQAAQAIDLSKLPPDVLRAILAADQT